MVSDVTWRRRYVISSNFVLTSLWNNLTVFAYIQLLLSKMEANQWHCLPDIGIIFVYTYLNDNDRRNMSLVCKNWSRLFHSSCLWRRRQFYFGGYHPHLIQEKACKFALHYGRHLRFLTIQSGHPSYQTCSLFQEAAAKFLVAIRRKSNIYEFNLRRLEIDRFWRNEEARDKLIASVSSFLKNQGKMKIFDMSYARVSLAEGCRILESLGLQSGSTLKTLHIEGLFHSHLSVFKLNRFQIAMSNFTSLHTLVLNYNCLFDEVLYTLGKTGRQTFKFMKIKVNR